MPGIGIIGGRFSSGGGGSASITVGIYSDAGFTNPITSADFGNTVYIKATPTGITPTGYQFFVKDSGDLHLIQDTSVSDSASWNIGISGLVDIYALATDDDVNWVGVSVDFEVEGNFYLNLTTATPIYSVSITRYMKSTFVGNPVVLVRRSSDNSQSGFTPTEIADGTLLSWVGGGDGFVVRLYDQSGNENDRTITTANQQFYIVISGVLQVDVNGKPKMVTQSTTFVAPFGNTAFSLSSNNGSFTMVSQKFRGYSYGTIWATLRMGTNTNLAITGYALLGSDVGASGTANTLVGSPRLHIANTNLGTSYSNGDVYSFIGNTAAITELTNIKFSDSASWLTNYSEFVAVEAGEISEFTLWDDDISPNRPLLNENAQSFYNY
jgi:hypothetical protein